MPQARPNPLPTTVLDANDATMPDARAALLVRLRRAVGGAVAGLSEPQVAQALTSATDIEALLAVMSDPAAYQPVEPPRPDARLAAARLRGNAAAAAILDGSDMVGADDLAKAIGQTRQSVDKQRKLKRLLAIQRDARSFRFPLWQVHDGRVVAGLDRVLQVLDTRGAGPWEAYRFFTMRSPRLADRTPIQALKRGQVDQVLALAADYGEQGVD